MLGIPRPQFSSAFLAALLTPALFALALLAPGGAAAAAGAEGSLTPELEQLSAPALAEASPETQAEAIGLPVEGPGSLSREGERVVVEAHFEGGALQGLEALEETGAKVLVASREYQTVALSVEPEDLEAVAEVPGVDFVAAARRPQIYATEGETAAASGTGSTICEGGKVISQGVGQLNVEAAREKFGARGRGVTVGVLSDSFNAATKSDEGGPLVAKANDDEASNDLPGPLNTCTGQQVAVRVLAEVQPGPGRRTARRGTGDAPGHPRRRAARPTRLRHRLRVGTRIRPQHRTAGQAGDRGRRRRQRDRRRRRLLQRALLPGRPGRQRDPAGHRSRRHLPDRGRQQQPLRKSDQPRNRLLGTSRIRRRPLPTAGR